MIKTSDIGIAGENDVSSSSAIRLVREDRELPCAREERLDDLASHLDFLWRFARRMGVAPSVAEDIAQDAFVIAASRIDDVLPGKERSYLVSVVVHRVRRERMRAARHEELTIEPIAPMPSPDEQLDDDWARRLLDVALASLDDDLRMVFILHEIEEETMADIAQMLEIAPGTVASRLRRARADWRKAIARLKRST